MNDESDDVFFDRKFNITKIEKTDPPEGMQEGEWYRYVIGKGSSEIQGKRPGTLQSLTEHAKEYASNLSQSTAKGNCDVTARELKKVIRLMQQPNEQNQMQARTSRDCNKKSSTKLSEVP